MSVALRPGLDELSRNRQTRVTIVDPTQTASVPFKHHKAWGSGNQKEDERGRSCAKMHLGNKSASRVRKAGSYRSRGPEKE